MTQKVIKFESLDSTNNYVAKALQSGQYSENDVILAGFQTAGRGQRGNIWQSEFNKNLTFSFAFPVDFLNLDQQFIISKAISVAIAEYLEEKTGMPITLKWPNDILVENQKICGILLETILVDRIRYMIVGIGLNINQAVFNIDYAATSLSLELGRTLNLDQELDFLLPCINKCIEKVKRGRADEIETSYLARLKGSRRFAKFSDNKGSYQGKIVFVDNSGEISVKSQEGELKNYRTGEVKIIY